MFQNSVCLDRVASSLEPRPRRDGGVALLATLSRRVGNSWPPAPRSDPGEPDSPAAAGGLGTPRPPTAAPDPRSAALVNHGSALGRVACASATCSTGDRAAILPPMPRPMPAPLHRLARGSGTAKRSAPCCSRCGAPLRGMGRFDSAYMEVMAASDGLVEWRWRKRSRHEHRPHDGAGCHHGAGPRSDQSAPDRRGGDGGAHAILAAVRVCRSRDRASGGPAGPWRPSADRRRAPTRMGNGAWDLRRSRPGACARARPGAQPDPRRGRGCVAHKDRVAHGRLGARSVAGGTTWSIVPLRTS